MEVLLKRSLLVYALLFIPLEANKKIIIRLTGRIQRMDYIKIALFIVLDVLYFAMMLLINC